jgi:hypothetical protein
MHFPEQPINWDYLLDEFVNPSDFCFESTFTERINFLFICGLSTRVKSLVFTVWRNCISNTIQTAEFKWHKDNSDILHRIQNKLVFFEDELPKLKEAATLLELALWKKRIHDTNYQDMDTHSQNKIKTVESSTRQQCRVTCGADVVIGHVLPFLIAA